MTVSRVLEKMTPPVFNKPARLVRAKFKDDLGTQEKDMVVLEYQLKVAEYTKQVKAYLAYKRKWEDNGPSYTTPSSSTAL